MKDRTASVYASVCVTLPFATLAVILRLTARPMTKAGYGYDDGLAILAFAGAVAFSTITLIWTLYYGLGRPLEDGPKNLTATATLEKSRLMLFCSEISYSFSIVLSQLTILMFYWKVFKFSSIRIPIQILLGASIVWLIMRVCITIFQCVPIQAFWDISSKGSKCTVHESAFSFATVLTHAVLDVLILVLPAVQIGKLRLRYGQKISIIALFMVGVLVCIASIFVLIEVLRADATSTEMPLDVAMSMVWAVVEVNLAIVSSSVPMLRPLFRKLLPGSFLSSHTYNQTIEPKKPTSQARHINWLVRKAECNTMKHVPLRVKLLCPARGMSAHR
ncbi:hypothetical protein B0J15DRAFT_537782 [Fusarium solani]|uniref:Rhodopsin domain-containing protein n=1 Tax=Fusarium solani TaxID=169388 RepID=A0A9P9GTG7_FUSSL|nr:uncharacterized protein B0J15DRAFT_537782 [Fusarium solani]KAH7243862.1 hypothetical protein B0J15DRAFT_537782 [Fusarium solani]